MSPTVSAVGHLLLVRLLVPAKRSPTRGDLKKSLDPFFQHRHSAAEWSALHDETLTSLATADLLKLKPLALTDAGRQAALRFLHLDAVPPRTTWNTLKNNYLLARALDLSTLDGEARKRLATADGLRAVVLKQKHALATAELPTLTQALDALAWKQLDIADCQKFTRETVLARCLGLEGKLTAAQVKARLAAQAIGARNTKPDELRLAVLLQWLDASPAAPAPIAPFNLASFAQRVQEKARATPTGRFGEHKVFINHVWRKVQQDRSFPDLTEAEFKQRLAEANQAGLLVLSRADLVEAMSPENFSASEVRYLNAAFHFIQI